MATIAILPEHGEDNLTTFSAVTAGHKATGRTAGEALDALTAQLSPEEAGAHVIIQPFLPDRFIPAAHRDRLSTLMARWRAARETGDVLLREDEAELERLVDEEVEATTIRAESIVRGLELKPLRVREAEEYLERARQDTLAGLHSQYSNLWLALGVGYISLFLVAVVLLIKAAFYGGSSIPIFVLTVQVFMAAIVVFAVRHRDAARKLAGGLDKRDAATDRQKAR